MVDKIILKSKATHLTETKQLSDEMRKADLERSMTTVRLLFPVDHACTIRRVITSQPGLLVSSDADLDHLTVSPTMAITVSLDHTS